MIPYPLPPLTGLSILVTRPAMQAGSLHAQLVRLGAQVTLFPALEIQPHPFDLPTLRYDLLIFISSNAVQHGLTLLNDQNQARIAAVGTSTAQALIDAGHAVDISPEAAANSEALLQHPLLRNPPNKVLIIKGTGGRELLRETLIARGSQVDVLEVYRRIPSQPHQDLLEEVQRLLENNLIDLITLTSTEMVYALDRLIGTVIAKRNIGLLTGSIRIAQVAREAGWQGECIVADSPEETQLIRSLTRWHTRARTELLR